jgi:uncharacterized protein YlxW (UPF0749 family)
MQPEFHVHVHNECCGNQDQDLAARVAALEEQTMTLAEDLAALTATVVEYNEDVQAAIAAIQDALAAVQAQLDAIGNPAELQAAFDGLSAAVAAGVAAVGDADADGNPVPTP